MPEDFHTGKDLIETLNTNITILENLRSHAQEFPDFCLEARLSFRTSEAHSQNLVKILKKSIKDAVVYENGEFDENCNKTVIEDQILH